MSLISRAYLSPIQNKFFQATWDWLAAHSNLEFRREVVAATTDDPDVLFMCGLPTGQRTDRYEPLVAPVLAQERYGGRPIYFSDLVVKAGTAGPPMPSWRIAYNDKESFSGWVAPRWGRAALGLEPDAMTWVVTGSHLVSLEAVSKGAADAAGIDSMVLDLISGDAAPAAAGEDRKLRTMAGPAYPHDRHGRAVRAKLAALFELMHEDPAVPTCSHWGVERLRGGCREYERLDRFEGTTGSSDNTGSKAHDNLVECEAIDALKAIGDVNVVEEGRVISTRRPVGTAPERSRPDWRTVWRG